MSLPITPRTDHPMGAEIVFDHVSKVYAGQRVPAVDDLSIRIPAGEMVMFCGPSGCGKTTTLKMINRLHEPSSGTITIDGEDITKSDDDQLRRRIGYVIQGGSLLPHFTVAQNIAMVPRLLKWDKQRITERVDELLELVGLEPARYRNRFPRELSGGQQQRVGVARGLAADPPVVLMDEPFGAVDPITRARLQDELMAIQSELRKTIVCVTHDIEEAIKLGDRILILTEGAHVAQYDTPENVLAAPANDFVADFLGQGNSLRRLSLARVREVPLLQTPIATVGEEIATVREKMLSAGSNHVVLLDRRRRPINHVTMQQLPRTGRMPWAPSDSMARVHKSATLNDALDAMLASTLGRVVVVGQRDQYLGVLTFDAVTEHIRQSAERARHSDDAAAPQPKATAPAPEATAATLAGQSAGESDQTSVQPTAHPPQRVGGGSHAAPRPTGGGHA